MLTSTILDILNNGFPMDIINMTDLVITPKKKNPETPLDFSPISLYNNIYKLLSKDIVNCMKSFMSELISDMHGAFVHDISIFDNILVAHEVVLSMKG